MALKPKGRDSLISFETELQSVLQTGLRRRPHSPGKCGPRTRDSERPFVNIPSIHLETRSIPKIPNHHFLFAPSHHFHLQTSLPYSSHLSRIPISLNIMAAVSPTITYDDGLYHPPTPTASLVRISETSLSLWCFRNDIHQIIDPFYVYSTNSPL